MTIEAGWGMSAGRCMLAMALAGLAGCSARSWIELTSIGEQDKPLPTIRFSTTVMPGEDAFRRHVVLPPREYENLGLALTRNFCANKHLPVSLPGFGTYKVERMDGHVRQRCVLTRSQTCQFARQFAATSSTSRKVLTELQARLHCDFSPTARRAAPRTITPATRSSEIVNAASAGDLERVRQLLAAGVSANEQECDDGTGIVGRPCRMLGWTPLMMASGHGHKQVVELLLRAGADPNVTDNGNHSALWFAQQSGYREVEQLLRDAGRVDPGRAVRK